MAAGKVRYTVRAGDTLRTVAATVLRDPAQAADLAYINSLPPESLDWPLPAGETILVPDPNAEPMTMTITRGVTTTQPKISVQPATLAALIVVIAALLSRE